MLVSPCDEGRPPQSSRGPRDPLRAANPHGGTRHRGHIAAPRQRRRRGRGLLGAGRIDLRVARGPEGRPAGLAEHRGLGRPVAACHDAAAPTTTRRKSWCDMFNLLRFAACAAGLSAGVYPAATCLPIDCHGRDAQRASGTLIRSASSHTRNGCRATPHAAWKREHRRPSPAPPSSRRRMRRRCRIAAPIPREIPSRRRRSVSVRRGRARGRRRSASRRREAAPPQVAAEAVSARAAANAAHASRARALRIVAAADGL